MDLGQILLGALIVAAIWYVISRRPSTAGSAAPERGPSRASRGPGPLIRVEDVVRLPPPPHWPALPVVPPGLDGQPDESARVAAADRPYARTTCPSCEAELDPLPKAKK